jgi:NAD(P)H-flavin reductase
MYSRIFCSRIQDEEMVLYSLVSKLISNGFCISNLTLFFMVRTNKDLCKSKAMAKNNPKTHTSLGLTFLSYQMINSLEDC